MPPTSPDAKVGELTTASHRASPDPTQFVPIGELERAVAEVNRLNQGISKQAAEDHVSQQVARGKLPPFMRDWGIALCTVNKPAFDNFVQRSGGVFNAIVDRKGPFKGAVSVRRTAELSDAEQDICERMGISPEDFVKARSFGGGEN